ncbi:MAG: urease accessory UreF family protein, partial [Frankia sp.]
RRATATATATAGLPEAVAAVLVELEAELDARTPSPAQRAASRAQGRALLRAARAAWPPVPCPVAAPHHPVALGLAARAAGLDAATAATIAAYHSVTGPAAAATRLLGLDPFGVTGVLARLGPAVDDVGERGTEAARGSAPADLPAPSAVRLDVLAEQHRAAEIRLFAS